MFKELDHRFTPLGQLVLRQRTSAALSGKSVFEVTLDGEFLMSSEVTASEEALARLGMEATSAGQLDVLVGGLGLGYTAARVLDEPRVRRLVVLEYLPAVIDWHRRGLVPLADRLCVDPRCALVPGDFFAAMREPALGPDTLFDVILVDIDHSPRFLLHPDNAAFYSEEGVARLRQHLKPGGVFALWSADAPSGTLLDRLRRHFRQVVAHTIEFCNPFVYEDDENVVVVAQAAEGPRG